MGTVGFRACLSFHGVAVYPGFLHPTYALRLQPTVLGYLVKSLVRGAGDL